tara:strand:+ start:2607 stop:5081 length:2475 start_codon:yes stop_codon:yes gene_type:complete
MPLLEETADLSNLSTGGRRDMSGNNAGTTTTSTSIPASVSVTPPEVVSAIEAAQTAGIVPPPPQRRFDQGETAGDDVGRGVFPTTPTPIIPPVNTGIGVDFFPNVDVKGFMTRTTRLNTDMSLNEFGGPSRIQINTLDIKGDFSPKFTLTDKALTTLQGSPLSSIPTPEPLFGNVQPQIFDAYSEDSRYPAQSIFKQSRLVKLGADGLLDSYYSQFGNDTSPLGIRNNSVHTNNLGFSGYLDPLLRTANAVSDRFQFPRFEVAPDAPQPYIIRQVGQRWGFQTAENKPTNIGGFGALVQIDNRGGGGGDVKDTFFNLIDKVNSGIIGRTPSVFLDRYYSDVKRINATTNALNFLQRGSTFVNTQDKLQKQNRFDAVTSTKYQISDDHQFTVTTDTFLPDSMRTNTNLGLLLELNPRAFNPLSVFSVPGVLGINRNSYIDFGEVVAHGTLADYISLRVMQSIQAAATKKITSGMESLAESLGFGRKAREKVRDDTIQAVQNTEQFRSAEDYVDSLSDKNKKLRKAAESFGLIPEKGPVGKASLNDMNIALSNVGVDKVNLIPYGRDRDPITDKGLDELDWIPFKFKDVRNKNNIVFRAILSGITDTFSPEYSSERYVGRPDNVHVYQGTNREIAFTFDVYPKSDQELPVLWEKLNYLAGLTYPHWTNEQGTGGRGMVAPYCELTIGQMYTNTPGVISSLTYTVQDNGNWETTFAKLPKYIQVSVGFTHIGRRLPAATQKHYELPWVSANEYQPGLLNDFLGVLKSPELYKGVGSRIGLGNINGQQLGESVASTHQAWEAEDDNLFPDIPTEVFDESGELVPFEGS